MKIIDITHGFYPDMPSYEAKWYPKFAIKPVMTPETDPAPTRRTFTRLELFAHNATHVDAPKHFFEDRESLDRLPLDIFIGRACIADLSYKKPFEPITADDIEKAVRDIWEPGSRLLIRTDYLLHNWGRPDFWDRPPYLTPSVADWVIENKGVLIGLDCLTEKPGDVESPVHLKLLGEGIPILEYITHLHLAESKVSCLFALPTKVEGVEASPVRAVLLENVMEAAF
ncbi:cyclase family protein [Brevibacillus ruminantium]|uniref:Cyclase family protein n=1 Tax=Brevibacillus ruminantium TaxID=2950604 RepID=A0ABY4WBQ1_9BACL|nr:cyclase family protein [Brevibacillus ruminantium]USG64611.1 cyclase family protein [Brevibacillus ruminantium]